MRKKLTERDLPAELKNMRDKELELLAVEIRAFLLDNISKTGGHLASNLGVVELTLALHKYFDSPKDKIIWDVGHQCYVHKILTGRAGGFATLRQKDGLSGFPKRAESEHDIFDTGHSSTSIGLMTGMCLARDLKGEDYRAVCVIGDGSLSGGPAYEALNNLGASKTKALVILNDNEMSIGKSTGGFDNHLGKLRVSKGYTGLKRKIKGGLEKVPAVGAPVEHGLSKIRDSLKYILVDGVIFEELGFTYLGPVDGHNIPAIIKHLELAERAEGPVVLHVITKKGKGYRPAEQNPETFHGTGAFETETGNAVAKSTDVSYSDLFGRTMCDLAAKDDRVVALSAAMVEGVGLDPFAKKYPARIFDVGIAEGAAVTMAAGMAAAGLRPVVAVYSTFLQRAYDQMMVDICLQKLPVIFAIDRAGCVGADGETHHGLFDISYLNTMPNMTVLAPRDGEQLAAMLEYALTLDGPCAIRYPRGTAKESLYPLHPVEDSPQRLFPAKAADGSQEVAIFACGNMVDPAAEARSQLLAKGVDCALYDVRMLKPLAEDKIKSCGAKLVVTVEDNVAAGGFGDQVDGLFAGTATKVLKFAWPDAFLEQGSQEELMDKYGLNGEKIAATIEQVLGEGR